MHYLFLGFFPPFFFAWDIAKADFFLVASTCVCRVPPYLVFLCMSCSMLCVFWRGGDCDMVSGGLVMAFRTLTLSHHKLTKRSHVKHEENISLALCTKRIITYCSWTQFKHSGLWFCASKHTAQGAKLGEEVQQYWEWCFGDILVCTVENKHPKSSSALHTASLC